MAGIRVPQITAQDQRGQLQQIKSFLFQLVEQLNMSDMALAGGGAVSQVKPEARPASGTDAAISTFSDIKALIIKSADIVNAYYEEINRRLEGQYVAESDFGTYKQETANEIRENSQGITQNFENIQSIMDSVYQLSAELIASRAWTKAGLLEYDSQSLPVYGFEVGQRTEVDGVEVFNKYARFTADGIFFYLPSSTEPVAWMNGTKLFITHAQITGSLQLGQYMLNFSDGIAFEPIGG